MVNQEQYARAVAHTGVVSSRGREFDRPSEVGALAFHIFRNAFNALRPDIQFSNPPEDMTAWEAVGVALARWGWDLRKSQVDGLLQEIGRLLDGRCDCGAPRAAGCVDCVQGDIEAAQLVTELQRPTYPPSEGDC